MRSEDSNQHSLCYSLHRLFKIQRLAMQVVTANQTVHSLLLMTGLCTDTPMYLSPAMFFQGRYLRGNYIASLKEDFALLGEIFLLTLYCTRKDQNCNPTALRKAKIVTLLHSERPKLYTILAFLSAAGLQFWPF